MDAIHKSFPTTLAYFMQISHLSHTHTHTHTYTQTRIHVHTAWGSVWGVGEDEGCGRMRELERGRER